MRPVSGFARERSEGEGKMAGFAVHRGVESLRLFPFPFLADPHAGGLERGAVQRDGLHLLVGRPLLRGPDDLWQLRALQPAGGHPGGRIPGRGERSRQREGQRTDTHMWG